MYTSRPSCRLSRYCWPVIGPVISSSIANPLYHYLPASCSMPLLDPPACALPRTDATVSSCDMQRPRVALVRGRPSPATCLRGDPPRGKRPPRLDEPAWKREDDEDKQGAENQQVHLAQAQSERLAEHQIEHRAERRPPHRARPAQKRDQERIKRPQGAKHELRIEAQVVIAEDASCRASQRAAQHKDGQFVAKHMHANRFGDVLVLPHGCQAIPKARAGQRPDHERRNHSRPQRQVVPGRRSIPGERSGRERGDLRKEIASRNPQDLRDRQRADRKVPTAEAQRGGADQDPGRDSHRSSGRERRRERMAPQPKHPRHERAEPKEGRVARLTCPARPPSRFQLCASAAYKRTRNPQVRALLLEVTCGNAVSAPTTNALTIHAAPRMRVIAKTIPAASR